MRNSLWGAGALALVLAALTGGQTRGDIILRCEQWDITFIGDYHSYGYHAGGGYSDAWWGYAEEWWHEPTASPHEFLSGEWAAAVYYDGAPNNEAMWLHPAFICPDFATGSTLQAVSHGSANDPNNPVNPVDDVNDPPPWEDWCDAGWETRANSDILVRIDYEIADLGENYASPMGTGDLYPGGVAYSGRYVLLQTYTVTNISGDDLDNVEFYQMLHSHPAELYSADITTTNDFELFTDPLSSYAPANYNSANHSVGNFRYDITQWNSWGSEDWRDFLGFGCSIEPDEVGSGYFAGHGAEPNPSLHLEIEGRSIEDRDFYGYTTLYGEVAGGMKWEIGTLEDDGSFSLTVALMCGHADCDENGVPDYLDALHCQNDCNGNGIPDACDIASGTATDANGDGMPDDCQDNVPVPVRLFVRADAAPGGSGASWRAALDDLQDALGLAASNPCEVKEIWVAGGVYLPDDGSDRTASFELVDGVKLYGGFAGSENPATFDLDDRDFVANETILSGDLNGDDQAGFINRTDNSEHVVYADVSRFTVIDGFTISGGNTINDGDGGAGILAAYSDVQIRNCRIVDNLVTNVSRTGGGVYVKGLDDIGPALERSVVSDNMAPFGGGVAVAGYAMTSQTLKIDRCLISDNVAAGRTDLNGYGGGLYCADLTVTDVRNSYVIGNQATGAATGTGDPSYGGGLASRSNARFNLINCTFADNTAFHASGSVDSSYGGGIACRSVGYGYYSNVANCIFWDNDADVGPQIAVVSPGYLDVSHCDVEGGQNDVYSTGSLVWDSTYNIDSDPLFVDAATGNYRLTGSSPCIDIGRTWVVTLNDRDYDGEPRSLDGDGDDEEWVDIGADEYVECYYVDDANGDDDYDGLAATWDGEHGPKQTIQAGVDAAAPYAVVRVASGAYDGAGNVNLVFDGKPLHLRSAAGYASCTIDGEANNYTNGFNFGVYTTRETIIEGFTVTRMWNTSGSGVYCNGGAPLIRKCRFTDSLSGAGGAVFCTSGAAPAFVKCRFEGNEAQYGGALYVQNSEPEFVSCWVLENYANTTGGGVYLTNTDASFVNSVISENDTVTAGGGFYAENSDLSLINCTIAYNEAYTKPTSLGGGLYCSGGTAVARNTIIWDNVAINTVGKQIALLSSAMFTLTYSDLDDGPPGVYNDGTATLTWGAGNIVADPAFSGGSYIFYNTSPCIDRADNTIVPNDDYDLDEDGDTGEPLSQSAFGMVRFFDAPTVPDGGVGTAPIIDMGAWEYVEPDPGP